MSKHHLPDYEPALAAFHQAHQRELRAVIDDLPLTPGARVLDVPCGDGCYALWLADRVGPTGEVIAADKSEAFLDKVRSATTKAGGVSHLSTVAADVYHLPFADNHFDLIWCAQSFVSLARPDDALREMYRVLKPGGHVGILENDELHHLLLPWPPELELAVRQAQLQQRRDQGQAPTQIHIGRRLRQLIRSADLQPVRKTTYATDRQWPIEADELKFLQTYLQQLAQQVLPYLDTDQQSHLQELLQPDTQTYLFSDPNFELTCLDVVVLGQKISGK